MLFTYSTLNLSNPQVYLIDGIHSSNTIRVDYTYEPPSYTASSGEVMRFYYRVAAGLRRTPILVIRLR
jgi:hypothetical protein